MSRSRFLLVLAVFALAPRVIVAQNPMATGEALEIEDFARPRRMIYFYETEPGTLSEFDRFLLYNSILTSVSGANASVVIVESPDPEVPITQEGREELARRVDADAWMQIYVAGGLADLTVRATLYDMTAGRVVAEPIIRPGFPVSYRTLARGFWDPIAAEIDAGFAPIVAATEATVLGRAGTSISNLPGGPYELDADGRLVLLLPTPATYAIEATLPGFVPVEESFYLGDEPRVVELVQLTAYRYAVDVLASSFQFPGVRFRYHFVPGFWFARVGLTTQYVGVNFVPNQPLVSVGASKLSTLYVDGGSLVGELDGFTRFLLAGGAFLRLRHEPFGLETDAALGGVHLSLGVELAPWRREPVLRNVRLFADYQPAFFFAPDPDGFLTRSLAWNAFPGGSVPLIYGTGWGVVDLRDLYLGVRFTW
ncbi:MAG: hypothetical protein ACOC1U_07295 [Spirochaetota bacterium]